MKLKMDVSLPLAKLGIQSFVLSGLKKNNLYNLLVGKTWQGTIVK